MIYVHTKIIRLSFICISSCEGEDLEKNNVKKSTPGNTACAVQWIREKVKKRIKNIKLLNCTIAQIGLGTINPICPGLKILLLQL